MEVMKLSAAPQHALLLRTSKLFYQLGRTALYRSIWITSSSSIIKLHQTFLATIGGGSLAAAVRRFELIHIDRDSPSLSVPLSIFLDSLFQILVCIRNVDHLQLYLEEENAIGAPLHRPLFLTAPFRKLSSFSTTLCSKHDHQCILHFLGNHPWIQHLSLTVLDRKFHRSVHLTDPTQNIELPELQSYSGPIEILKLIVPSTKNLSSIVIHSGERNEADIANFERDLKALEPLEKLETNSIHKALAIEVVVSPDNTAANVALKWLPKNLTSLSFQYNMSTAMSLGLQPSLVALYPFDPQQMKRFQRLTSFSMNCVASRKIDQAFGAVFPEIAKVVEVCPSLESIQIRGKVCNGHDLEKMHSKYVHTPAVS
ncbi:hypothetical protein K435DRAFT_774813 [Dendrothele bispora CBS 962.96]|uniref:F-box domain-containing protein n=1 Tax=Dendrothele bispora (strain CBS 962.96) TaxID=1314807 RepID=A0A4V4HHQ8_DENBC|nr:hypothetical protein K435DRAFT_774813 [Dendrothele bispora CBS 962.96]